MQTETIKRNLTMLKFHVDSVDNWVRQATDMIYAIEEAIFDTEDQRYFEKYESGKMQYLKEAASRICQMIDSPPRLNAEHCADDSSCASGFLQREFDLKKIV